MSDPDPSKSIDHYLSGLPEKQRIALEKLRHQIRALVPAAEETISYQVPSFKYQGSLVGFAAFKTHLSFFVMNSTLIETLKEDLGSYKTSAGTIQFQPEKPLPASLIKKIVKARIKENELIASKRSRK